MSQNAIGCVNCNHWVHSNMPIIQFHKYQGTGNDFVMIDDRALNFDQEDFSLIEQLCDRRFGIGADGVILIQEDSASDFRMVYFNPDGSQSLCGNGSRCAVMFARQLGMIDNEATFSAFDGRHQAFIQDNMVHLQLHDVGHVHAGDDEHFIDTGSPHLIKIVEGIEDLDVKAAGSAIRYSERFREKGVNINFIEKTKGATRIRTYERGVENETLSCGTGCTAAALTLSELGATSPVTLNAQGGTLKVSFEKHETGFKNIFLIGPAEEAFKGQIEL